jgi:hypothetical protein
LSCLAEAAKSSIYVFLSTRAHTVGNLSEYIAANRRMVADRRKGLQISPKGSLVNL